MSPVMGANQTFAALQDAGLQLRLRRGRLQIRGDRAKLTDELKAAVELHAVEFADYLSSDLSPRGWIIRKFRRNPQLRQVALDRYADHLSGLLSVGIPAELAERVAYRRTVDYLWLGVPEQRQDEPEPEPAPENDPDNYSLAELRELFIRALRGEDIDEPDPAIRRTG